MYIQNYVIKCSKKHTDITFMHMNVSVGSKGRSVYIYIYTIKHLFIILLEKTLPLLNSRIQRSTAAGKLASIRFSLPSSTR